METDHDREQAVRDGLAQFRAGGIIGEVDVPMRRVFVRGLKDVDALIILASIERLLSQPGRRYPLTLPEWLEACADVVDERRQAAARQAKALQEDCPDCHGSGWADAEGPNAVVRCNCILRVLELVGAAGEPMRRPQLMESNE